MSGRGIVTIGASAGGVAALLSLVRTLPADFNAAVFVVLHVRPQGPSVLPQLLDRAGELTARHAKHGEPIQAGRIYVAPPDHHLLIQRGVVHLGRGPTENGSRPSVDPLFRTAAHAYGPGVIGVVLSGSLDDGTAGLLAIKRAGGLALVQDPLDAAYPSMPSSAIENVAVDGVHRASDLGSVLGQLVREADVPGVSDLQPEVPDDDPAHTHAADVAEDLARADQLTSEGIPSGFACPDCHGVLWEVVDGSLVRYRCRVGHAYQSLGLVNAQADRVEEALWMALRTLKESAELSSRLAQRARERNMVRMATTYEARVQEAEERAAALAELLKRGRLPSDTDASTHAATQPVRALTTSPPPDAKNETS